MRTRRPSLPLSYHSGSGVEQLKKPEESEIEHYVRKIKEHEAKRLSFNERMAYWNNYNNSKNM